MNTDPIGREQLIESVGIVAADKIMELQSQVTELVRFLDVVAVHRTTGFRYEKAIRPKIEELRGIE